VKPTEINKSLNYSPEGVEKSEEKYKPEYDKQ
jgi:hypothetical protein